MYIVHYEKQMYNRLFKNVIYKVFLLLSYQPVKIHDSINIMLVYNFAFLLIHLK